MIILLYTLHSLLIPSEKRITKYFIDNKLLFENIKDQFIKFNGDDFRIFFKDDSINSDNYSFLEYIDSQDTLKSDIESYFMNTPLKNSVISYQKNYFLTDSTAIHFYAVYSEYLISYYEIGIFYIDSKSFTDNNFTKIENRWYYNFQPLI